MATSATGVRRRGGGEATLRALRRHRVPAWWADAKLGIFIHWTPAAVPGYAPPDGNPAALLASGSAAPLADNPYTEWYANSLRLPDSPVARHHREHYGDRSYDLFADDFRAGLAQWDPDDWADRFARTGARYVVLVTKHHDGFCLWPSEVPHPHRTGWHTERDVVGELAAAVRARGLRFGVYYSGGLDWTFDDRPIARPADLLVAVPDSEEYAAYAEAQVRELIERYRPSILWNDIAWPFSGRRLWQLFADYYAAVPDGLVNDRWMPRTKVWDLLELGPVQAAVNALAARFTDDRGIVPPKPPHFDVRTPEYTSYAHVPADPWECCRGIDRSFGYNRASRPEHFLARDELLEMAVDVVSKGGNLLLNVGPRGEDAAIPDEQQQRLDWLGTWMATAGDALVGIRPWVRPEGTSPEGHRLRYTARGDDVHVLVLDGPADRITLTDVAPGPTGRVVDAGGAELAAAAGDDGAVTVDLVGVGPAEGPRVVTVTAARARPRR